MSESQFSPRAAVLWSAIPDEAKERILKNVFCVRCGTSAEIIKFTGTERGGDIILNGQCAKCGHEVVRVVETSETNWEHN